MRFYSSSILFILFQLSNGLKLGINTRINRISEALQHTSCDITTTTRRTISTVLIGTLVTCFHQQNANAAEASQLYAKAESAIVVNLKDYQGLDKDWSTAKGIIKENAVLLTKASNALISINAKMTEFDTSFSKIIDDDLVASNELNAEIVALRETSGSKYASAVASAAKPDKPSVTAQLFSKAQNEASTLAQDVCDLIFSSSVIFIYLL